MGEYRIRLSNVLGSLQGNKDRNLGFHTSHEASVAYLKAINALSTDVTLRGDEVIAPGTMVISRLEAEVAKGEHIVGINLPKFANPLVVGDEGRTVTFDVEQIPTPIKEGAPELYTQLHHFGVSVKTTPIGVTNIQSKGFERKLRQRIIDTVQFLRDNKGASVAGYAKDIYGLISCDLTTDMSIITTQDPRANILIGNEQHLPTDYQSLDIMRFLLTEKQVPLASYNPQETFRKGWLIGGKEPRAAAVLDETYGAMCGAYPLAEKVNDAPTGVREFEITEATLESFCKSINITPAEYHEKHGENISPIIAAYIAVDPLLAYSEEHFSDEHSKKAAAEKLEALRNVPLQVTKVYVGQTLVARPLPAGKGVYHVIVGLNDRVRVRARNTLYSEDIQFGYLVLTPDNQPYVIGESKVRRVITPKQQT